MAKVRISHPKMEYGGAKPNVGNTINGTSYTLPARVLDTRWFVYGDQDPYHYAPNGYSMKSTLPEVPEEHSDIVHAPELGGYFRRVKK